MRVTVEVSDELMCATLREAMENCVSGSTHPDDRKRAKKLVKAANLLIEYFGGVPLTRDGLE